MSSRINPMNIALNIRRIVGLMALAGMATLSAAVVGQEKVEDSPSRQFWADAKVLSFRPGEELASYRWNPAGGVGPDGTLMLGVGMEQRHFDVRMDAKLKEQRFLIHVTVKPTEGDTQTK